MYIPKESKVSNSLVPFTGCDEKACPLTDCVRHPDSGFQYNSMGHLSYICKKYKEEMKKKKDEIKTLKENKTENTDKEAPNK